MDGQGSCSLTFTESNQILNTYQTQDSIVNQVTYQTMDSIVSQTFGGAKKIHPSSHQMLDVDYNAHLNYAVNDSVA